MSCQCLPTAKRGSTCTRLDEGDWLYDPFDTSAVLGLAWSLTHKILGKLQANMVPDRKVLIYTYIHKSAGVKWYLESNDKVREYSRGGQVESSNNSPLLRYNKRYSDQLVNAV